MVQFRDEEIALFLGVLAVGDVHEGGHRPTRIALGIAQGRGVAEEIARRTILEPGFRPAPRASWSRPTWAKSRPDCGARAVQVRRPAPGARPGTLERQSARCALVGDGRGELSIFSRKQHLWGG